MGADLPDRSEMLLTLIADIVSSHLGNNKVGVEDVPTLISAVHSALAGLGEQSDVEDAQPDPAVPIRASIKKDHLVCLEDGRRLKTLKRHLMSEHGMTPAEYRERWDLPADYPMVASEYAATRRDLAIKLGLGRKPGQKRGRAKKGPARV